MRDMYWFAVLHPFTLFPNNRHRHSLSGAVFLVIRSYFRARASSSKCNCNNCTGTEHFGNWNRKMSNDTNICACISVYVSLYYTLNMCFYVGMCAAVL